MLLNNYNISDYEFARFKCIKEKWMTDSNKINQRKSIYTKKASRGGKRKKTSRTLFLKISTETIKDTCKSVISKAPSGLLNCNLVLTFHGK